MKYITLTKALEAWRTLQPLSERDRERLARRFTIDFNYNSNHIEGNTLTYGQTELLLLFGKIVGEASVHDVQEMTASNVGLQMASEQARLRDVPLTQHFIRTLHSTLLRDDYRVARQLPCGQTTTYTIHAGQYKTRPNSVITRYGDRFDYASPEETPAFMADLVDWYNREEAAARLAPNELAALFHYRYIRIHPFEDGNGRIARLLVNYILARHDWPMFVVRSRCKGEYLEALHQADLLAGPLPQDGVVADLRRIHPFLKYFNKTMAREIYGDVLFLTETDADVWWYDGERVKFRSPNYSHLLRLLQSQANLTLEDMARNLGISGTSVQKLLRHLTSQHYVERNYQDGSWRVFLTPTL